MNRYALIAAALLAMVAPAVGDTWNYNFEQFTDGTDWGHDTQTLTTEGWTIGGSSTSTYTRGVVETYGATKAIGTTWYYYVDARVGYATGGTGNIITVTDLGTADSATYTWQQENGYWGSADNYNGLYDYMSLWTADAASSIKIGQQGVYNRNGDQPWYLYSPGGTYAATKLYIPGPESSGDPQPVTVKLVVDLAAGTGTVYFDDVADVSLTDVDLVGTSGLDLRNLVDIGFYCRGGKIVDVLVGTSGGGGPHPGDANEDEIVDLQDFGILKNNFGTTTGATWGDADFNDDGGVDLQDFGILKEHFGHTPGDPLSAVPEPATMSLLALGALGLIRRRR